MSKFSFPGSVTKIMPWQGGVFGVDRITEVWLIMVGGECGFCGTIFMSGPGELEPLVGSSDGRLGLTGF